MIGYPAILAKASALCSSAGLIYRVVDRIYSAAADDSRQDVVDVKLAFVDGDRRRGLVQIPTMCPHRCLDPRLAQRYWMPRCPICPSPPRSGRSSETRGRAAEAGPVERQASYSAARV